MSTVTIGSHHRQGDAPLRCFFFRCFLLPLAGGAFAASKSSSSMPTRSKRVALEGHIAPRATHTAATGGAGCVKVLGTAPHKFDAAINCCALRASLHVRHSRCDE